MRGLGFTATRKVSHSYSKGQEEGNMAVLEGFRVGVLGLEVLGLRLFLCLSLGFQCRGLRG